MLGLAIFGYTTASIASYFVGERESAIGRATEEERDELLVLLAEVRALRRALEGTDEAEPPPPASAA